MTIAPFPCSNHHRQHEFAAQEHCLEVEVDLPVPDLFGHRNRIAGRRAANIIDQDIDPLEAVQAGLHHLLHLRGGHHVAAVRGAGATFAFDDRFGRGHRFLVDIQQKHRRPLPCEQDRRRLPVPPDLAVSRPDRPGARDDRDFPRHIKHSRSSLGQTDQLTRLHSRDQGLAPVGCPRTVWRPSR